MGRTRSGRSNPGHSGGELLQTELSGFSHILLNFWSGLLSAELNLHLNIYLRLFSSLTNSFSYISLVKMFLRRSG